MQRDAFRIQLFPGMADEYKRRHADWKMYIEYKAFEPNTFFA